MLRTCVINLDRNQWQDYRIETAQQTMQSNRIEVTDKGGDGETIFIVFDCDRHSRSPIWPTPIELPRHLDLIGCRLVQGEFLFDVFHH